MILAKIQLKPTEIRPEIESTVKFYKINVRGMPVDKELTRKALEANGYIVKKWITDYTESFLVVMVNKQI